VVVKLFGLGSLLACASVFRALKQAHPTLRLTVISLENTAAAARLMPDVDEMIAISPAGLQHLVSTGLRAIRTIRRRHVDVIVDIEYFSKLSTLFCFMSGARYHLGFLLPARWRHRLIDGGIAFREDIHFRECVARLLAPFGVDYRALPPVCVDVMPTALATAEDMLGTKENPDRDWMIVNPHANELCRQRRWPLERYAHVSATLLERHAGLHILVPGTEEERPRAEELCNLIPAPFRARVHVLAGRTDLQTLAAVLKQSRLVLSNDTGIMHLAAAVGAPLVALFGPESPMRYAPLLPQKICRILAGNVPCGPCLSYMNRKHAPCGCEPAACMLSIPVEEVIAACEELL